MNKNAEIFLTGFTIIALTSCFPPIVGIVTLAVYFIHWSEKQRETMTTKQYQAKYAETKRKLHTCAGGYGSKEYTALKSLMNYYYAKGFN